MARSFNRFIRGYRGRFGSSAVATLRNGLDVSGAVYPGDELTARFPAGGGQQAPTVQWTLDGAEVSTAFTYTVPEGAADGAIVAWTAVDGAGRSVSGPSHAVDTDAAGPITVVGAESAAEIGSPVVVSGILPSGAESTSETGTPIAGAGILALGAESPAEAGVALVVAGLGASGASSTSEVGAPSIATSSGAWAYSGSTVTNIPTSEGWAYSGSTVTTIPEAA